jgi:CheY-like chemotaxis protein
MKKILIVDDLEPFITQEKTILSRVDFRIFTAKTGEEALNIHRGHGMDLILVDLNMPGMAGDEMTRAIRQDPALRTVSVIIICSQKKADVERCASCGANDYVTRPLNPKKLLDKTGRLLDVPQRRSLRVLIKVTVKGRLGADPFFGTTHDISTAGVLLETDRVLARGDVIACSFFIPDSERMNAEGEVMRVVKDEKGYRYGIRFLDLGDKDRAAVEAYVKRQAAEKAGGK